MKMELFRLFLSMSLISGLIFSCGEKNAGVSTYSMNIDKELASEDVVIDEWALQDYFETEDIEIDTLDRMIIVSISGSQLLSSKKRKMASRWGGPEPWVSVAATYQAKAVNENIDSLIYRVTMEEENSRYSYSIEQLKKAANYLLICDKFARYLNNKDYKNIIKLLSSNITDQYNDVQLKSFIRITFGEELFERTELIGTKIVGSRYSFYINFWNTSNQAQTYAFTFLEGSDRIAGMQIVE